MRQVGMQQSGWSTEGDKKGLWVQMLFRPKKSRGELNIYKITGGSPDGQEAEAEYEKVDAYCDEQESMSRAVI